MSTDSSTGGADEPQGDTPPYAKDEGTPQENPISKSSGKTGPVSEGREISDEESGGVGDTDMNPDPALGVGESINRRGESVGKDSGEEGTKDPSGRPYGKQGDEGRTVGQADTATDTPMAGQGGDQGS